MNKQNGTYATGEHHEDFQENNGQVRVGKERKAVYTIVEREGIDRNFWVRLGAAFVNKDGSLTVLLDAYPSNGRLHIRDLP